MHISPLSLVCLFVCLYLTPYIFLGETLLATLSIFINRNKYFSRLCVTNVVSDIPDLPFLTIGTHSINYRKSQEECLYHII